MKKLMFLVMIIAFSLFVNNDTAFSQEYEPFESLPNIKDADEYFPYDKEAQFSYNFTFPSDLPNVPAEILVYKTAPEVEPTYQEMKSVGDLFGMGEDCEIENIPSGGVHYANENNGIEFQGSTDSFTFEDFTIEPVAGELVPDEATGNNVAETYLRDKGLWRDEFVLEGFGYRTSSKVNTQTGEVTTKKKRMMVKYKMKTVVNNIRTIGGAEVTILPGSGIKSVRYYLIEANAYKLIKAITPEEAIDRIYQGNALFRFRKNPTSLNAVVEEFIFTYQASGVDPVDNSIRYSPVYSLKGHTEDGVPFTIDVSAVEDYYLKKKEVFATVTFQPSTLSLSTCGEWGNCYIELPEGYSVASIPTSTVAIMLGENPIYCETSPVNVGDFDNDGIQDIMVTFDKTAVQPLVRVGVRIPIIVTGEIGSKTFRGIDYINVIDPDNDADADGICDDVDNCPTSANPGQEDADADTIGDVCDPCPNDPNNDIDGDTICGDVDNCPTTANTDQLDSDADTIGNVCDPCPYDPDNDLDGDGLCGAVDNCPAVANPDQADSDTDTIGDVCDNCPADINTDQTDSDVDGIGEVCDNCPTVENPDQLDSDSDNIGDVCDACPLDPNNDIDGDGVCGDVDNCPTTANPDQMDSDDDTIGDVCDPCPYDPDNDIDGDGVCGDVDNCPDVSNPNQEDIDGDGIGDACDPCDNRVIEGSIIPSETTLWPPNHDMAPITVDASNLVLHNPDTQVSITSVTITESSNKTAGSNFGENVYDENNFEPDYEITGNLTLNLRKERSGASQGRTYTITVTATDCSGDYTFITEVAVPHDQGQ
jgi:hypothetical protein